MTVNIDQSRQNAQITIVFIRRLRIIRFNGLELVVFQHQLGRYKLFIDPYPRTLYSHSLLSFSLSNPLSAKRIREIPFIVKNQRKT